MRERPDNNMDFLRLAAAFAVIVGHQYAVFGLDLPQFLGTPISVDGVKIFFALSGYLLGQSWDRDPRLVRFALRRLLRIMPAFVVLVLLTVVAFGPLVTSLTPAGYFTDGRTYDYLANCLFYISYVLPGMFETNPIRGVVNGSLWSLPSELVMYAIIAIVGCLLAGRLRRLNGAWLWGALFVGGTVLNWYFMVIYRGPMIVVYATSLAATVEVGVWFLAGVFIWKCRAFHRPRLDLAVLALIVLAWTPNDAYFLVEGFLSAYAVLGIGLARTPILRRAGRFGDFSYGLYLYAFPLQQLSYQMFGRDWGWWMPFLAAAAATSGCAALSWYLVERYALGAKPKGPLPVPVAEARLDLQKTAFQP
jgi:peptidoglycan/LPS O-acetylase OafA/YrhL